MLCCGVLWRCRVCRGLPLFLPVVALAGGGVLCSLCCGVGCAVLTSFSAVYAVLAGGVVYCWLTSFSLGVCWRCAGGGVGVVWLACLFSFYLSFYVQYLYR